jgi:hypothetical protein
VVDCNLVAFILSCITQATWKRKFALLESRRTSSSIHTQLRFFCRRIFCSPRPPRSLALCYHLLTLPHVDAIASSYYNVHECSPTRSVPLLFFFSFWIDGTPKPVVCSRLVALVSFPFVLQHSRSCFPNLMILSNFRSPRRPFLFFLIFFLSPVARWCALWASYPS